MEDAKDLGWSLVLGEGKEEFPSFTELSGWPFHCASYHSLRVELSLKIICLFLKSSLGILTALSTARMGLGRKYTSAQLLLQPPPPKLTS